MIPEEMEPHIIGFPANWLTAPLCDFHAPMGLYREEDLFKLDQPYTCPICRTTIEFALNPSYYREPSYSKACSNEFCEFVTALASEVFR